MGLKGCIATSVFSGWGGLGGLGGWAGGVCMSLEVPWAPSIVIGWFASEGMWHGFVMSPYGLWWITQISGRKIWGCFWGCIGFSWPVFCCSWAVLAGGWALWSSFLSL